MENAAAGKAAAFHTGDGWESKVYSATGFTGRSAVHQDSG
jgi:hypothetical protein